ncbi:unnamed protein product [Sphagnum balticum]
MVSVGVARGILVESPGPTWMLGTASEHSILYQYNFFGSTNTLAGMIQTESPYYQYTTATESPGPFNASVGLFSNDPIFPDASCDATTLLCSFSWAVVIQATANLSIPGAGLYSCGAVEMLSDTNTDTIIYAKNNTQATIHPFWSILGAYADDLGTESTTCGDDDTSAECNTVETCDFTLNSIPSMHSPRQPVNSLIFAPSITRSAHLVACWMEPIANYTDANNGYDGVFNDYTYLESIARNFDARKTYLEYSSFTKNNELDSHANEPSNELADTYGIEESWVDFTTVKTVVDCSAGSGHGSNRGCEPINISQVGYPTDSGNVTVSNPKDIITDALPTVANLSATIVARQLELVTGAWYGPTDDLVQVS